MATKRIHRGKALEQQVIRLQTEGWHVANIASIAHVDADTVRTILKRQNIAFDHYPPEYVQYVAMSSQPQNKRNNETLRFYHRL